MDWDSLELQLVDAICDTYGLKPDESVKQADADR